jgi:hypothetical protein
MKPAPDQKAVRKRWEEAQAVICGRPAPPDPRPGKKMPDLDCDTLGLATPRTAVSIGHNDSLMPAAPSQAGVRCTAVRHRSGRVLRGTIDVTPGMGANRDTLFAPSLEAPIG